jgi:hypothetical protein
MPVILERDGSAVWLEQGGTALLKPAAQKATRKQRGTLNAKIAVIRAFCNLKPALPGRVRPRLSETLISSAEASWGLKMAQREPIFGRGGFQVGYIEGDEAFDRSSRKRCRFDSSTGNLFDQFTPLTGGSSASGPNGRELMRVSPFAQTKYDKCATHLLRE